MVIMLMACLQNSACTVWARIFHPEHLAGMMCIEQREHVQELCSTSHLLIVADSKLAHFQSAAELSV